MPSKSKCNSVIEKKCNKQGKMCNPKSGRCVKVDYMYNKPVTRKKPKLKPKYKPKPKPKQKTKKVYCSTKKKALCQSEGKYCNSKTGHCKSYAKKSTSKKNKMKETSGTGVWNLANLRMLWKNRKSPAKAKAKTKAKPKCSNEKKLTCYNQGKYCNQKTGLCKSYLKKKRTPKKRTPNKKKCNDEQIHNCLNQNKMCNLKTGRCVMSKSNLKPKKKVQTVKKKCDLLMINKCFNQNKICNSKTGRCVKTRKDSLKKVDFLSKQSIIPSRNSKLTLHKIREMYKKRDDQLIQKQKPTRTKPKQTKPKQTNKTVRSPIATSLSIQTLNDLTKKSQKTNKINTRINQQTTRRCSKGFRKNKITGECDKTKVQVPSLQSSIDSNTKEFEELEPLKIAYSKENNNSDSLEVNTPGSKSSGLDIIEEIPKIISKKKTKITLQPNFTNESSISTNNSIPSVSTNQTDSKLTSFSNSK